MSASANRRLAAALAAMSPAGAEQPVEIHSLDIPDPIGNAEDKKLRGRAGNSPLGAEVQGYQRFRPHPPPFDPNTQQDEAFAYYQVSRPPALHHHPPAPISPALG